MSSHFIYSPILIAKLISTYFQFFYKQVYIQSLSVYTTVTY